MDNPRYYRIAPESGSDMTCDQCGKAADRCDVDRRAVKVLWDPFSGETRLKAYKFIWQPCGCELLIAQRDGEGPIEALELVRWYRQMAAMHPPWTPSLAPIEPEGGEDLFPLPDVSKPPYRDAAKRLRESIDRIKEEEN